MAVNRKGRTQQLYERSPNGPLQSPGLGALALTKGFYFGSAIEASYFTDLDYMKFVFNEIGCATPENSMHPNSMQQGGVGNFNFAKCDQELAVCQGFGIPFRGHYLVNGRNTEPSFLTTAVTSAATATSVLTTQINGIMAHYKGKFKWVNVVNESIAFGGNNGFQTGSVFYQFLGTDPNTGYIAQSLRLAKAADPAVKVGLNFSGVENSSAPNAEALIQQQIYTYCKQLLAAGVPLDFVGMEMHMGPNQNSGWNAALEIAWLAQMANLGVKLHITEMDRDDTTTGTLAARDATIATDINNLVVACLTNPALEVLQVWELSDRDSWLNRGFGQARSDNLSKRPTLLSWAYSPKTAYTDVRNAISAQRPAAFAVDKIVQVGGIPPQSIITVASPAVVTVSTVKAPTVSVINNTGGGGGGGGGSGTSVGPNYPGGMTVVTDTGPITPTTGFSTSGATYRTVNGTVPTTLTNIGPSAKTTAGFWANNLMPTPSPDTGYRIQYDSTLAGGGNSPVVVTYSDFAVTGTGHFYISCLIRLVNWNFSLASGLKLFEPRTVVTGNNHVIDFTATGTDGNIHPTGSAYPQFLFQGTVTGDLPGGGNTGIGVPPNFTAPATIYANPATATALGAQAGTWVRLEYLIQPETPTGTNSNNGQISMYVNGTLQFTSVGKLGGVTGINYNSNGWAGIKMDPTYGGDPAADHPPNVMFLDVDQVFIAVA